MSEEKNEKILKLSGTHKKWKWILISTCTEVFRKWIWMRKKQEEEIVCEFYDVYVSINERGR